MRLKHICATMFAGLVMTHAQGADLISPASQWQYYDKSASPASNWYQTDYDHSLWMSGFAELGYGDGDETTVTSFGDDSSNKPITQYFAKPFTIEDLSSIDALKLRVLADDGAVVYINGTEAFRLNLPINQTHDTLALDSAIESVWIENSISSSLLRQGENLITVEVHQLDRQSSDISFDLALTYTPVEVVPSIPNGQTSLIEWKDEWAYWDQGNLTNNDWQTLGYSDSQWQRGEAELGYGDNDENTQLSYGSDANNKHITSYFRKRFQVEGSSALTAANISLIYDDGAIVYLNGEKLFLQNMPDDVEVDGNTLAVTSAMESEVYQHNIDPALLIDGENILAVEVHQMAKSSSDVSFDLQLNVEKGTSENLGLLETGKAENVSVTQSKAFSSLYRVTLGEGVPSLEINTSGGSGDADLYVRYGEAPTLSDWDKRPYRPGNSETVNYENPQAGVYFISLYSYKAFADVQLIAHWQDGDFGQPELGKCSENELISRASTWKYLDNGSDQATHWQAPQFDDSTWAAGSAPLGYSASQATTISYGGNSNDKHITSYFRQAFELQDLTDNFGLNLEIMVDDGAVIYLNGNEVGRVHMDEGTVNYQTKAKSGNRLYELYQIPSDDLIAGKNVVSVEVHQSSASSSDVIFDMALSPKCEAPDLLVRGPYLQSGTHQSMVVRWRTGDAGNSIVRYGSSEGQLDKTVQSSSTTTEHELMIGNLQADTRYYYQVETNGKILSEKYSFVTNPVPGDHKDSRIWILGDSGRANQTAADVRDAFKVFNNNKMPDAWLMLGDNAYDKGTDLEYQQAVFDMYPEVLAQSVLWPNYGNHDAGDADARDESGTYFDIFTLPKNGEAGGLASQKEAYFSFDYGDVHFINLDLHDYMYLKGTAFDEIGVEDPSMTDPESSLVQWLKEDLAANQRKWVVVYWHHPPYSNGGHNSDTTSKQIEVRKIIVPILDQFDVDLVFNGHSHNYERSFVFKGHYGTSDTLESSHVIDGTDGSTGYDGTTDGIVYVVAGHGAQGGVPGDHPVHIVKGNSEGSVVLDVKSDRLELRNLNDLGQVHDFFFIKK